MTTARLAQSKSKDISSSIVPRPHQAWDKYVVLIF